MRSRPAEQEAIRELVRASNLPSPLSMKPMGGGANNRVYRLDTDEGPFAAKVYFRDERGWDRLGAEYRFLQFAWREKGIRSVPRPLSIDAASNVAIYEFIEGEQFLPGEVAAEAVSEALTLYAALNHGGIIDCGLGDAAEACFSLAGHVDLISNRIRRLEEKSSAHPDLGPVVAELRSLWRKQIKRTFDRAAEYGMHPDETLDAGDRRISPSDFGFHNALRQEDGSVTFLDFEYAGVDDPAKMVADFFNQVAVPVPTDYYNAFRDAVAEEHRGSVKMARRIDLLVEVYIAKWVCIVLNSFDPEVARRREYASGSGGVVNEADDQLKKANVLIERMRRVVNS